MLLLTALALSVCLCTALAEAPNGPIVATVYGKVIIFSSEMQINNNIIIACRHTIINTSSALFQVQGRYTDTAQVTF